VSCRPDGQAGARSRAFLYGAVLDGPTGIEDRVFTGPLLFGVLQRAQPKFKPAIKNDKLRHHVSVTAEFDDYRALVAWGRVRPEGRRQADPARRHAERRLARARPTAARRPGRQLGRPLVTGVSRVQLGKPGV